MRLEGEAAPHTAAGQVRRTFTSLRVRNLRLFIGGQLLSTLSFLPGCVTAVDMPTRQSFYLEMVGPEDLTNAMSLNTATFTGSRILGAALGGLLIGAFGVGPVFLINGITYGAVIVALLM